MKLISLLVGMLLAMPAAAQDYPARPIKIITAFGPGTATELLSLHLNRVFFEQNQLGFGSMLSLAIIATIAATLLVGRWATLRMERSDRTGAAR